MQDALLYILKKGDKTMEKDRYLNQSIIRALRILELFAQREEPLGVTEISRLVGLHKSTVHRLVITLETSG
jgi:DNA-binding MarR family transcriptional regulator